MGLRTLIIASVLFGMGCGSDVEPEPSTPMPAVGSTWQFSFESGVWQEPANVSDVLAYFPTDYNVLLGVHAVDGDTMDVLLAIANEDGTQDLCTRTVFMKGVKVAADGSYAFGPSDFTIANGLKTENLVLKGIFVSDMKVMLDTSFSGDIVASSVPADMMELPEGVTLCEVLAELDLPCTACNDGSEDCLRMEKTGIAPEVASGGALTLVEQADCHASCPGAADNPDCE